MDATLEKTGCRDVENLLQPYLEYKLDYKQCRTLLSHLKECHECRDELEIRYLLHEGLDRLENGQEFNLKAELEYRIEQTEEHVLFMERLKNSLILLLSAGFIFVLVHIILMLIG